MISRPLFLCGFMGVGKTTVAKLLSKKLGCEFIDTDRQIVERAGRSIPEIFEKNGEAGFRALERQVIESLDPQRLAVIALGGGALNAPGNLQLIRRIGRLIYLSANLDTLAERLAVTANTRPLLAGLSTEERVEQVEKLLQARLSLYLQADDQVNTDGRRPSDVADDILKRLGS